MKSISDLRKDRDRYSAYAPDLPGCITTGPTLEETERLMKEAIEFQLRDWREDGLPIPDRRRLPHRGRVGRSV